MAYIKTEYDIQQKIASGFAKFVEKGVKFNGISIAGVKINYEVEYGGHKRYADIAVLKDDGYPLLIIETKKKYEKGGGFRIERRFHVTSEEVIGQAFSYVVILKLKGVYVPFVATANDKQIAVFQVPEDIDKHVDWEAVKQRDYSAVLSLDYIYGVLRTKYLLLHKPIRFEEGFFAELLETLTGLYVQKYRLEDVKQEPSWILIEDFRGFVDTLAPFILDAIAPGGRYSEQLDKKIEEYAETRGYKPSPEQLAREMAYVLLNKILFYKVLERYYKGLDPLEPLYSKGGVKTVSEYLKRLSEFFEKAIEVTGDFEPVFKAGIYDYVECVESIEVLKLIDWLINFIDRYRVEKLGDIIGYVYEELIPAEERHQLGQFYTPKPIAELIVKWCIRSPDDKVLDPGCGSGTFLIETYKRLAELKLKKKFNEIKYVPKDVHEQILSQLYGVDINEFPAHLTAINLAMRNPRAPSSITNVIVEDYFSIIPGQRRLTPYKVKTAEGERPVEIVFKEFDIVVGNPPYTRWGELSRSVQNNILNRIEPLLRKYELHPLEGRRGSEYNMVVFWIMHSHGFLKEGGRLGMIVSDSWLQTDYGIRFGKFLAEHFKIHAIIDFSSRVFPVPMIATCVVLLEKSGNEVARDNNDVVFAHVNPGAEQIDVDELLNIIVNKKEGEHIIGKTGKVVLRVVKQQNLRLSSSKWLSYILGSEEKALLEKLANSPFLRKLDEFFEPVYGNTIYTVLYTRRIVRTRHAGIGGEDFFYLTSKDAEQHEIPEKYLYPLIPSPKNLVYFTFTKQDWENIKASGGKCYLFLCREPRNQLPQTVQNYIRLGETSIVLSKGDRRGQPVSRSRAADERRRLRRYFRDWYDLGGVINTRVLVTRYARYWHRFVYSAFSVALDDDIMSLIPRIELDDIELKALLSYLNSSFKQLQVEMNGRVAGGVAVLGLETKVLGNLLILDVKKLPGETVERLAHLFDELDAEARRLGGADVVENVFGFELAKGLTGKKEVKANVDGLFNTVIKKIDYEVGRILGFTEAEIEALRGLVVELAKRRLGRAGEAKPTAIKGEEKVELVRPKKKTEEEKPPHRRLDEWAKK